MKGSKPVRSSPRQSDTDSDVRDMTVGQASCVLIPDVCVCAHRCSRPRSKERAVVVAWERRLMVVGDAPESIQYPWRAARG